VNLSCPQCGASYFVDEVKIPEKGGRLTCPTCKTRWNIFRPGTGEMPSVAPRASPLGDVSTSARSRQALGEFDSDRWGSSGSREDARVSCPKCGHAFVPAARARSAPTTTGRKVVLLVEDQKYFTELASEALGPDYRTVSVSTRDEALKVIGAEPPCLMILDLSLARGQDGRDLLRAIPGKSFPILIFTARDETELYGDAWEELKRLGADDIVHKGMNVGDELRRKVAALIARK
jgi:predicted Zn finger-like uncharacterized protein